MLGVAAGASLAGALLRRRVARRGRRGRSPRSCRSRPALFALRGGELAAYHGVEHKAIAAYEARTTRTRADAAKEHDRCGSHLVAPMLAANLAGTLLLRRVLEKPGPLAGAARRAGVDRGRGRGLRLVRAPRRHARSPSALAPAGLRAPAR